MGGSRSTYRTDPDLIKMVPTPEVKKPFRIFRWKWEDNIKVSF
jgi:hypothetical protein